jgi:hypothetical protein
MTAIVKCAETILSMPWLHAAALKHQTYASDITDSHAEHIVTARSNGYVLSLNCARSLTDLPLGGQVERREGKESYLQAVVTLPV